MRSKCKVGDTYVDSHWGYVMEKSPSGKWVRQHRLRMENHIGRKLNRGEVVHHIDGDRANNEMDNLELMSDFEHRSLHAAVKNRYTDATKAKMRAAAYEVADRPGESQRRSERAKKQHAEGRF